MKNLENQILEYQTKSLQEEIDWGIMCDLMKEVGWTHIETTWDMRSIEEAYELREWCKKHLKGHHKGRGRNWLFEKETDAVVFALRWT